MSRPDEPENWKPVQGFADHYAVSNLGRIRRVSTGKILTPSVNDRGRLYLFLCVRGKPHWMSVDAIVATAFLGPRPKGHWIYFRDDDRLNVRADNLEYRKRTRLPGRYAERQRMKKIRKRLRGGESVQSVAWSLGWDNDTVLAIAREAA